MPSSMNVVKRVIAQNHPNAILMKYAKNISNFSFQKLKKSIFWATKCPKLSKNLKFFECLLIGIDLEWSKTYFKCKFSPSTNRPDQTLAPMPVLVFVINVVYHPNLLQSRCNYQTLH